MKDRYELELREMHNHRDGKLATPRPVRVTAAATSVPVPSTVAASPVGRGMMDNHHNGNVNVQNSVPSATSSSASLSFLPPEFLANAPFRNYAGTANACFDIIAATTESQYVIHSKWAGEENMDENDTDDDVDDDV